MKNPRIDVIKAFRTALSGITYGGNPVEVVVIPGKRTVPPYIQLDGIISTNDEDKYTFGHLMDIDVTVVTQAEQNWGDPTAAETISNDICQALLPTRTSVLTMDNFKMVTMYHTNQISDQSLFDSNRGYRVVNTFSFILDEKFDISTCWLATGTWNGAGIWGAQCVWNA